jgi:hypothetical protein
MNSLIPQVLATSNPPQEGLVVGIDMLPYSLDITEEAGVIHWELFRRGVIGVVGEFYFLLVVAGKFSHLGVVV